MNGRSVATRYDISTHLQRVGFFGDELFRRERELTTAELSIGESKVAICAGQCARTRGRVQANLARPILLSPVDKEVGATVMSKVSKFAGVSGWDWG